MATYTAFATTPRVTFPIQGEDGVYRYFASVDVIVMDADNAPVPPYGMAEPWWAMATLNTVAPILASDTTESIRQKIATVVRANWAPTVTEQDILRLVFLDGNAVVNA